ncbi:MAG: CapA family protein [Gammaproteobacteria bacterium]|nr:CapA family protein [Gammaproteobacteria bacterium]
MTSRLRKKFHATRYGVVLLVAGCAATPAPEPEPEPPDTTAPAAVHAPEPRPVPTPPPPPPPPPKASKRITFAAVGDMMLGTDFPENHLPDDDGLGFLAEVAPVLRSADVAIGNLEGVLVDGGEPAKKCSNPQACYLFRSPSRYVEHYRNAGFDVMSLANNHARDFGDEGRVASMQTLAAAGILHSGLESDFATFEFDGLKIAVMAYAVTRNSNMLLDYDLARATVAGFAGTHDIVVVTFHGGAEGDNVTSLPFAEEEYFNEPRGDVVKFSRMMVDAGADFVFGHGPHVVRAMENYEGRLIAYSLGNFATYYGISVQGIRGMAPILEVTLDGNGVFVEGRIHSTEQIRPAGPSMDPGQKVLRLIERLSLEDFGSPGILFRDDGAIEPAPRQSVRALTDTW